jgi:branched-chain amino acid transport system substrate-binding protein
MTNNKKILFEIKMEVFMKKIGLVLLVLLVLVSVVPVFSEGQKEDTEEVNFGIMFALSGAGSALGVKQTAAAELAVAEVNANGGITIDGKKVLVNAIVSDTETKPDAAIRKMKAMVNSDKIVALVGGTFAHVSGALSDQTKRTPIVYAAANGVAEDFFTKENKGPYTISPMNDNNSVGRGAATYIVEVLKATKVVVCLPDYAYGHYARSGVKEVFDTMPNIEYEIIMTAVGAADMTPYLIKAKEYKPDVIMMGQWGNDAINILKQAYDMRLQDETTLFFNWITDVFAYGIAPEAIDGVLAAMYWYHDMAGFSDPAVVKDTMEFNKNYKAETGEDCDPYALSAYIAVKEILRGMENANSTDPGEVYKAIMANPEFNTPKGKAVWGRDGKATYDNGVFIMEGLGPDEREVANGYAKIIDSFDGETFMKPASQLGW